MTLLGSFKISEKAIGVHGKRMDICAKNIANIDALPNEVKEKINEITFGDDSIAFSVNPIGEVVLQIMERTEPVKVVLSAVKLPIPLNVVLSLEKVDDTTTHAVAEIQVELNMFIRPMVEKPLTEGAKKFGELLAILPYNAM